jgi:post-segregation antitoxin (ccd killing protein)
VTPSRAQANYAAAYPSALQTTSNDYVNTERDARRLTTDFARYPDQLKDPPWALVQTVVTRADEAGRSASYVEGRRQSDAIDSFFTSDNNEITRRVAGSAQYVTKKKECDVDVSATVGASLKEAVDKQLEKRLRARNDAHLTIERYRDTLGRPNAVVLEKQADDISSASYLANVHAVELRGEALRLIDEASTVKHTLEQGIGDERTFQAEPRRSAADKKASSERIAKLQDAEVRIDAAIPQLQGLTKDIDQRNEAMRAEYAAALDGLKKTISARASAR